MHVKQVPILLGTEIYNNTVIIINVPMKTGLFCVQAGLDKAKSGTIRIDELPNLQCPS